MAKSSESRSKRRVEEEEEAPLEEVAPKSSKEKKKRSRSDDSEAPAEKTSKKSKKSKRSRDSDEEDKASEADNEVKKTKKVQEEEEQEEQEAPKKARRSKKAAKGESRALTDFDISPATIEALHNRGILELFPIQALTYQHLRAGKDIIGRARTGQGKTLAFCLPIIEQLLEKGETPRSCKPYVICLTPTRELAKQIVEEVASVAPTLKVSAIYGGTSITAQCQELRAGVHIVVCTPGRVLDLLERRALNLSSVTHVVLDEADRMLDMGFQDDMDKIFEAMKENPAARQVALFSATLPPWVQKVAKKYMSEDVVTVDLVEDESQKAAVSVRHVAIPCQWTSLAQTIGDVVSLYAGKKGRTIVFCETKKDCNELCVAGGINVECQALHGDISQQQRETTLTAFKQGRFGVLVATDVAARGLDMVVDLVINAKPPVRMSGRADTETYVHRSGRTGRANRSGVCVTLYTPKYRQALKDIEREVGNTFEWRGAPQPHEIIAASGRQAAEQLDTVDKQAVEVFLETAQSLIETMGAERALAAALACMTGHTQALRQRSLLSNTDGYVTIMFHANREIPTHSYVFGALRRNLPEEVVESIRGMAITADGLGAVFDTPVDNLEQIKDAIKRAPFQFLSIPESVPELKDREYTGPTGRFPGSAGGRGGRGGWGGRGGSSYGGRGGGRGGYSSGRGGRGRGRF